MCILVGLQEGVISIQDAVSIPCLEYRCKAIKWLFKITWVCKWLTWPLYLSSLYSCIQLWITSDFGGHMHLDMLASFTTLINHNVWIHLIAHGFHQCYNFLKLSVPYVLYLCFCFSLFLFSKYNRKVWNARGRWEMRAVENKWRENIKLLKEKLLIFFHSIYIDILPFPSHFSSPHFSPLSRSLLLSRFWNKHMKWALNK